MVAIGTTADPNVGLITSVGVRGIPSDLNAEILGFDLFTRYANNISDLGPAFDAIVESFRNHMVQQFATEGEHLSGGWAPLSPLYEDWKGKYFPGQPILRLTGALEQSAINPAVSKSPKRLSMTVTDPSAEWHQAGRFDMPARPVVVVTEGLRREWTGYIQVFIGQVARQMGL